MTGAVLIKSYGELPICQREVLRYAGCKEATDDVLALLDECIKEAAGKISFKVCYRRFDIKVRDGVCDFGDCCFISADLAKNLAGCNEAVIFAATVGAEFDRLIAKYSRLSPAKALMLEALGNERIEALCDAFCSEIGSKTKPRYSAGYGDLAIDGQRDIFNLLDCQRKIGLTLNDSLLMSPSKSVTAIVGIVEK